MSAINMPALFEHCKTIWDTMDREAENIMYEGRRCKVYEGSLTKLFRDEGFSVPYYSSVMKQLKDMDCVMQLRRGGGGSPSQWLIIQKPTPELFAAAEKKSPKTKKATEKDQIMQALRSINQRLTKVENYVRAQQEQHGPEV